METWMVWIALAFGAANAALAVRNWRLMLRLERLDSLLMDLCVEAYRLHHTPIWQAWGEVMGRIRVVVHAERRPLVEDMGD